MHAEIARAFEAIFDWGLPLLNETRPALHLGPLEHVLDQLQAAERELLATSRAFDFPAESLPIRVRYVGPQLGDPHRMRADSCEIPPSASRPESSATSSSPRRRDRRS